MSIPYQKLMIPKWQGPPPEPVEREAFYIGGLKVDPPVVLAPMAAVTNAPYRKLCREMGAGLVVTEMVYSELLIHHARKSRELLDLRPDESPVSVQLYGKDPEQLAEAARICEAAGADAVDLNMGCPMRKVVASGHGAALLRDPKHVEAMFQAMTDVVSIPVTGKIRAGFEDVNATDVAKAIAAGGGAAVTIHGRTKCEKYEGHADLSVIATLKSEIDIPVIGNGDVRCHFSARRMFQETGCDGVMVARGCLGNPWAFSEIQADLKQWPLEEHLNPLAFLVDLYQKTGAGDARDPFPLSEADFEQLIQRFIRTVFRHVTLYIETFGIQTTAQQIRKHLIWYFRETPLEKTIRGYLKDIRTEADIKTAIHETLAQFKTQVYPPRSFLSTSF